MDNYGYNKKRFSENLKKLDKLQDIAKSWKAIMIKPWTRDYMNGGGITVFFNNGYAMDIALHDGSYGQQDGLFEIAIMTHTDCTLEDITYDTPITSDILGWQSIEDCAECARSVRALPNRQ